MVTAITTDDERLRSALRTAVEALSSLAEEELDPATEDHMRELGESKETCSPEQRAEHAMLVELWRKRTLSRLRALDALQRLREAIPDWEALANLPRGA